MKTLLLWLTITVSLFACTRKSGDSCRVNGDCDKDLVCCLPSSDATEGICTAPEACVNDGGTNNETDAGTDGDTDANTDAQ